MIYNGTIGTIILIDANMDISQAQEYKLIVKRPNGTIVDWYPEVYENQYLKYTTVTGDLDLPGLYRVQPYLKFESWSGYGTETSFTITKRGF